MKTAFSNASTTRYIIEPTDKNKARNLKLVSIINPIIQSINKSKDAHDQKILFRKLFFTIVNFPVPNYYKAIYIAIANLIKSYATIKTAIPSLVIYSIIRPTLKKSK